MRSYRATSIAAATSATGAAVSFGLQVLVEEAHQEAALLHQGVSPGSKGVERPRGEHALKRRSELRVGSLRLRVEDHEVAEAVMVYVERPYRVRSAHLREEGLDLLHLVR